VNNTADKFIFKNYNADFKSGFVEFFYNFERNKKTYEFKEILRFKSAEVKNESDFEIILKSLHLALGVSYWKTFCPKIIETPNISLTKSQAEFWNTVYTKGLGEFFFRNNIDFRGLVSFPYDENATSTPVSLPRKNRSLVGIGGGKDSIVTAELLKASGKDFSGFEMGSHPIRKSIIDILGVDFISIEREIDPEVLEINKMEDAYNGHVPISMIYAFVALFGAALYDYRYIIVSNEKSSNYGNVEYLGEMVNHQWSKSYEFELLFKNYVFENVTPDIVYFSFLRPFYEFKITELFSKYPKYFNSFSSCNTNFGIKNQTDASLWCGKCAKCAFVFSMLSAFIPKNEMIKIFNNNLFAEASLLPLYSELLGIKDFKPFDCVGTPEEVKLAFYHSHLKGEYEKDSVMEMFVSKVLPQISGISELEERLAHKDHDVNIPEEFKSVLNQI